MEQGYTIEENTVDNITNIDTILSDHTYFLTRDETNAILVEEQREPSIAGLNTINRFNVYGLTRNLNNELVPDQLPDLISNTDQVVSEADYVITRDGGDNLIARELGDNNVRIPKPVTGDLFYAIRKQGNNFTLNRTPALTDYIFEAEELQFFATFNIFANRSSRAVHVCNRAKYPNVGIPVISTPLTIHVVKYIFTSSINRFIRQDHDVKIFLTS